MLAVFIQFDNIFYWYLLWENLGVERRFMRNSYTLVEVRE